MSPVLPDFCPQSCSGGTTATEQTADTAVCFWKPPAALQKPTKKKANQVNRGRKHFCFKWYVGIWVGERQWNCSAGIWLAPCR